MSASNCMRSGRLPFGRSRKVGGNNETFWNHTVPPAAGVRVAITRRFSLLGSTAPTASVRSYFRHLSPNSGTTALARTLSPLPLSNVTSSGPAKFSARAWNDAR